MSFVHLHNHSHYSLLDGLSKIDEFVKYAKELGMDAIALTDHGNLYGSIEFYKKAKKEGIKPILGVEAYIAPKSRFDKSNDGLPKYYHITLLAKNNTGWKNLIKLVTKANLEGFYYKPRIDKEILEQYKDGIIAMSGCASGEIARNLIDNKPQKAREALEQYHKIFGDNFYIEIWHQPNVPEIQKIIPQLVDLAKEYNIPLVATQDTHYLKKEDAFYHGVLLAVQTGNKIEDNKFNLHGGKFHMRSIEEMENAFSEYPEALENTAKIANMCNVEIDLGKTFLPKFPVPNNEDSFYYLKKLLDKQIKDRYPNADKNVYDRIEYELSVIEKMGFADYFLIVQDFINWAKERKIVVGPGRGSAAGSIVSYILKITNVDPIKYDLLFERFLNPERVQMPDIDIDITDIRRDEVFGYLQDKYGKNNVAHIITFGTMAARAAIRDAGRALGMTYSFCDKIAKLIPFGFNLDTSLKNVTELKEEYVSNPDAQKLLDAAKHLEGVARHVSVHACGTVISEKELTEYLPLQYAPQDQDTIITQFEGHAVEDLGLLKIDILGLKNLTIIENTIRLVKSTQDKDIDLDKIPFDDKGTFEMLQKGDTTGVFQLESSGMRKYLKESVPTELEDITAMIALYRPGPIELIPTYIARKLGKEKVTYLHPKLKAILGNTYGIGIYQEQMMRIARDLAGYSLAEADILRKAIGKKIKSLLAEQKEKIICGMEKNGIEKNIAKKIWDLFPPFARYGFNRSHAVSYAHIAYQTAYLKNNFPVEFATSMLNSSMSDIDRISFLISEIKKMGIKILPPDINKSFLRFSPEDKNTRFGLAAIKNVGKNVVNSIIKERQRGGPYKNFEDFLARVTAKDLNKKSLESLTKSGVFDSLNVERNTLLSNMEKIILFSQQIRKQALTSQNNLFGGATAHTKLILEKVPEVDKDDILFWEKELLGFYFSEHPMKKYEKILKQKSVTAIKNILDNEESISNLRAHRIAGVITSIQRIMTKKNDPMLFAKIEDMSDTLEIVVFPNILQKNENIWQEKNIVIVQGKISLRDNEPKIICDEVVKLN